MARPVIAAATRPTSLSLALGFLGAFAVGSLAVQLLRSAPSAAAVQPVLAHQAALWDTLAQP